MARLLSLDSGIVGLYRSLMRCDRMYVELITKNRPAVLAGMRSKEQMKFMKAMAGYPSVLRTEYALSLLHERDETKAAQLKKQFDKAATAYPYPSDIESERELRRRMTEECEKARLPLYMPEFRFCGDNGAMIASAAYWRYLRGETAPLTLNAVPGLRLVPSETTKG